MSTQPDVYSAWLGIKEPKRPLHYYALLRLKNFEDDPAKVRENFEKMAAHVRKKGAGGAAQQAAALVKELRRAMLCLTDARAKAQYDSRLGRKDQSSQPKPSMAEALAARGIVDAEQLGKAQKIAKAMGIELTDALVEQNMATPEALLPAVAMSLGMAYLDPAELEVEAQLVEKLPGQLAKQHNCVPLCVDGKQVVIAAGTPLDPSIEEELAEAIGSPVRTVLSPGSAIEPLVAKHFKATAAAAAPAKAAKAKAEPAKPAPEAKPAKAEKSAKAEKPTPAKPEKADDAPLSAEDREERSKARVQWAVMAFNFCVMAGMAAWNFVPNTFGFFMAAIAILPVAGLVAGIVWLVKK